MRIYLLAIAILLSFPDLFGQSSRADKLFERGDYRGALKLYVNEYETKKEDNNLKIKIANSFFFLNDIARANQFYKLVDEDLLDAPALMNYAYTLQRSGEYAKAKELATLSEEMGGDAYAAEQIKASADFAQSIVKEKPIYSATKTGIDLSGYSAGAAYYKGKKGVILASPNTGEGVATDTRGYKATRFYHVIFSADGKGGKVLPFADELTADYSIGAATFTKDFSRIYYTKIILKQDGSSILKLMTAENVDGTWQNIQELDINSDDYSCAHPALYNDSLLFFVSDMPDGIGGKDIYMATVQGGYCSEVQNLGETINTPEEEVFPTVDEAGRLYFASSGHVGLGGLDVFMSQMQNGAWTVPQNMGRPVNSSMDDFGLVFKTTENTEGYVSSNRGGTGVFDYIFSLRLMPKLTRPAMIPQTLATTEAPATYPVAAAAPAAPTVSSPVMAEERPKVTVAEKDFLTVDYNYAIQIGAFRNPVPRVYFDNFQGVKVYKGYDNIYRYAVGEYPDERIAEADLGDVKRSVHDAFVVNVDRYIADRKIQNGREGDKIDDNELLLIRLRNFELDKRRRASSNGVIRNTKRNTGGSGMSGHYLEKTWTKDDHSYSREGYTVVLMSTNKILDMATFKKIGVVDIYQIEDGGYNYCTDTYTTLSEANRKMQSMRSQGFPNAYVVKVNVPTSREPKGNTRNSGLKELLDMSSF